MKRLLLLSSVLLWPASTLALASDLLIPKAPPPPYSAPAGWTGPYAGLDLGGAWGSSTIGDAIDFTACKKYCDDPTAVSSLGNSLPGFIGGGHIGYNWQTGQLVWGAEADAYGSTQKSQGTFTYPPPLAGLTETDSASVGALGTVRGRVGWAWGTLLPYATAGFAWQDVSWSQSLTAGGVTSGISSGSQLRGGWTIGGGIEWAISSPWVLRAQYLFIDTGTLSVTTPLTLGPLTSSTLSVNTKNNLFTVGASLRF